MVNYLRKPIFRRRDLKHLLYLPILCFSLALSQDATASRDDITYTLTNCGQEGCFGPGLGQCESEYSGTTLEGHITMDGYQGYQEWTVPINGVYSIEVRGAEGGIGQDGPGGFGAKMKGDFALIEGENFKILIGQRGNGNSNEGTGGGGTFVANSSNAPIIIDGGGSSSRDGGW